MRTTVSNGRKNVHNSLSHLLPYYGTWQKSEPKVINTVKAQNIKIAQRNISLSNTSEVLEDYKFNEFDDEEIKVKIHKNEKVDAKVSAPKVSSAPLEEIKTEEIKKTVSKKNPVKSKSKKPTPKGDKSSS